MPLAAAAFVLGAQLFFRNLAGADQVFALSRDLDAAQSGGVSFVLVRLVLVEAHFFGLQKTAGHLHAPRKATEQRFKTLPLFPFDVYHR